MIIVDQCPFCGHQEVECYAAGLYEYAVNCPACRAIGPVCNDVMASIAAWNKAHRMQLIDIEL